MLTIRLRQVRPSSTLGLLRNLRMLKTRMGITRRNRKTAIADPETEVVDAAERRPPHRERDDVRVVRTDPGATEITMSNTLRT